MRPEDVRPAVRLWLENSRWQRLAFRVWPGLCVLCDSAADLPMDLCSVCLLDLPWNTQPCDRCGLPLTRPGTDLCGACFARSPPQRRTVAALRYEDDVAGLVTALKFGRSLVHGRILARLMVHAITAGYAGEDLPRVIVPVPLSARRLFFRGHNQAGVLARYIGRELGIDVDYASVRRRRHTAAQAGQSRTARLRNLQGAFVARSAFGGGTVAIVDDVMTTGTTVKALARTLLASGAGEVHVWVAARTPAGAATARSR